MWSGWARAYAIIPVIKTPGPHLVCPSRRRPLCIFRRQGGIGKLLLLRLLNLQPVEYDFGLEYVFTSYVDGCGEWVFWIVSRPWAGNTNWKSATELVELFHVKREKERERERVVSLWQLTNLYVLDLFVSTILVVLFAIRISLTFHPAPSPQCCHWAHWSSIQILRKSI